LAPYTNYFKGGNWNNIKLYFLGRKKSDAKYHLQRYESKNYKPKTKYRFDGNIYILINGPSFSATTLMLNAIKGQSNIVLVGEETGGGWYGNSGILLPEFVLPNTQTRLRMPLFRLVQFQHNEAHKGKGVPPDILVPTSYDALIKGYDMKIKMVDALIDSATRQSSIK
jgi:C-terminal processing protease CtpA/Prc